MSYTKTDLSNIPTKYNFDDDAEKLITAIDPYIENFSQFDLDARCHKQGSTREDYLNLCRESIKDFSEEETYRISDCWCEIDRELKRHGMQIPNIEQINLVRTSGKEENDTIAYTRGNTIFICDRAFAKGDGFLEHVLVHELFHILTRNCLEFKKEVYSIIGYHVEDTLFTLPQTDLGYFISNPDVNHQLAWCRMKIGFKKYDTVCVNFTEQPYHHEPFSKNLYPRFLALNDTHTDFLRDDDNNLIIFSLHQCTDSFLAHVGRNTHYLSHEEEALAENFVFAVLGSIEDLPNLEIVEAIREVMHYINS